MGVGARGDALASGSVDDWAPHSRSTVPSSLPPELLRGTLWDPF